MRAPSGALIQFEVQNFSVSNSSEVLVTFENVQPGQVYELWSQVSRLNRLTSRMNLSEALLLLRPLNVNKLIVYTAGNRTIDLVWQEPLNGNYDEYLVSVQESNGLTHFANYTQLTQVRVPELDTNKTYLITVVTCVKLRNRCDTISSPTSSTFSFDTQFVSHLDATLAGISDPHVKLSSPVKKYASLLISWQLKSHDANKLDLCDLSRFHVKYRGLF